ncbi:MAG: DnaJ domain-containing protein [Elainellaceae cyanobacterium]
MSLADCYRLLELRTGASFSEIKASYRRLARLYHPDVNPDNQERAREKFIQLTDAYKTLMSLARSPSLGSAPHHRLTNQPEQARQETPTRHSPSSSYPPREPPSKQPPPSVNPPSTGPVDSRLSGVEQKLKQSSYEQLQRLLREKRFPRAITLVEGLSQRIPNDPEIRQWQAIAYERWGRHLIDRREFKKAQLYLRKALRTDPNNRSLWSEIERDFRRIDRLLQVSSK